MAAQEELRHGACPQFQHSPVWGHGVTAGPWLCAVTSQPDPAARSRPGSAAQPLLFPAQERSRSPARLAAETAVLLGAPRAHGAGRAGGLALPCCVRPEPGRPVLRHPWARPPGLGPTAASHPAGAARSTGLAWIPSCLEERCRGEERSQFRSSPQGTAGNATTRAHGGSAAAQPHHLGCIVLPGRARGGVGCGAAPGPGTRSAAQLGPMKPAQLPARAPYVQPCHTEGRAALGGTDLSSTCRQNPTLPGRSAVLEVGGVPAAQLSLLQPHGGPHGSQPTPGCSRRSR